MRPTRTRDPALDPAIARLQALIRIPTVATGTDEAALWGRGTLGDKASAAAICEAAEALLADGFVPEQDVWISLGCDEEVGGAIAQEAFPGMTPPLAVIGVAEPVTGDGGHASVWTTTCVASAGTGC